MAALKGKKIMDKIMDKILEKIYIFTHTVQNRTGKYIKYYDFN